MVAIVKIHARKEERSGLVAVDPVHGPPPHLLDDVARLDVVAQASRDAHLRPGLQAWSEAIEELGETRLVPGPHPGDVAFGRQSGRRLARRRGIA